MTLGRGWRISSNHGDPKEPTVLNLGKNRYVPVKVTAPADLSGTAIPVSYTHLTLPTILRV